MIDFEIPEETKAIRDKVRTFVREECHPAFLSLQVSSRIG